MMSASLGRCRLKTLHEWIEPIHWPIEAIHWTWARRFDACPCGSLARGRACRRLYLAATTAPGDGGGGGAAERRLGLRAHNDVIVLCQRPSARHPGAAAQTADGAPNRAAEDQNGGCPAPFSARSAAGRPDARRARERERAARRAAYPASAGRTDTGATQLCRNGSGVYEARRTAWRPRPRSWRRLHPTVS